MLAVFSSYDFLFHLNSISYIVEHFSTNDLLLASCLVNSGQKLNKQRPNPAAMPAAHLIKSGLSCKKHTKKHKQFTQFLSLGKS